MRLRLVPVLIALVGAAVYWSVGSSVGPSAVRASSSSRAFKTTVYFLTDGGTAPLGVRRSLVKEGTPQGASLRAALASLFAGPTRDERRGGLTSAIPKGTRLLSLSFKGVGGSGAVVNLRGLPLDESAFRTAEVITQIARTTIGLSGILRVWLRDDGKPWGLRDFQGRVLNVAHDYTELVGLNVGTPNGTFTALP